VHAATAACSAGVLTAPPPLVVVGGVEVPSAAGGAVVTGFGVAGGRVVVGFGAALGLVLAVLWPGDGLFVVGLELVRADTWPAVARVGACAEAVPAASRAVVTVVCAGRGLARFGAAAKPPGTRLVAAGVVAVLRPELDSRLPPLRANNPPPASPAAKAPPTSATTSHVAIFGIS
jgi:hypothetical protein